MHPTHLTRRLFATSSLSALAACNSTSGTTTTTGTATVPVTSQWSNGLSVAQTVDQALLKIIADANTLAPTLVTTNTANATTGFLNTAATEITALMGLTVPPAGSSTLTVIDTYLNDAVKVAEPILALAIPGAAPIIGAIDAVEALLPVFEALIVPTPAAAIARQARLVKRARPRVAMSLGQALAVLSLYLGK